MREPGKSEPNDGNDDVRDEYDGHQDYLNQLRADNDRQKSDASTIDVHDGHRDYLPEVRNPLGDKFLNSASTFVAILIALMCGRLGWIAGQKEHSFQIGSAFFGGIGFLSGMLFFAALYGQLQSIRQKRVALVGGIGFFVLFFVLPVSINSSHKTAAKQVEIARDAVRVDENQRAILAWRLSIETAEAHGATGVEPPMLAVVDYGTEVHLLNITDKKLECVLIRRAPNRPVAVQGTVCTLDALDTGCINLNPNEGRSFPARPQAQRCEDQKISFRIGGVGVHAGPSWWSDSELELFDVQHPQWALRSLPDTSLEAPRERAIELRRQNDAWAGEKVRRSEERRRLFEKERIALAEELASISYIEKQLAALAPKLSETQSVQTLPPQLSFGRRDWRRTITNTGSKPIRLSVHARLYWYTGDKRRSCALQMLSPGIDAQPVAVLAPGQENELIDGWSKCRIAEEVQLGVELSKENGDVYWMSEWLREARLADARERREKIEHRMAMIASALSASD